MTTLVLSVVILEGAWSEKGRKMFPDIDTLKADIWWIISLTAF